MNLGAQNKRRIETVLLSTHNIYLVEEYILSSGGLRCAHWRRLCIWEKSEKKWTGARDILNVNCDYFLIHQV